MHTDDTDIPNGFFKAKIFKMENSRYFNDIQN